MQHKPKDFQKEYLLTALDVYSFGVTMYELFSQKHIENNERLTCFLSTNELLELFPCLTLNQANEVIRIGNSCLEYNPKSRPSFAELQKHLLKLTANILQNEQKEQPSKKRKLVPTLQTIQTNEKRSIVIGYNPLDRSGIQTPLKSSSNFTIINTFNTLQNNNSQVVGEFNDRFPPNNNNNGNSASVTNNIQDSNSPVFYNLKF
ncbi:predicted protein [Naegleria gruberi]|uniref:Predicted protein n=1 Tax=Naegleria gruberi TaxID=5762 RepID=D2W6B6_NAEGR|nr:uncharacterized protein NAEGRDRAFT_76959 [Naegleria gruberi]EFC35387.1 predicted protein [Naegleria gruberi]|eukprot:XP_002668131.1 predicted protein [Naegleria gruberi strain NEG-M]